jgi:hypothetical protein
MTRKIKYYCGCKIEMTPTTWMSCKEHKADMFQRSFIVQSPYRDVRHSRDGRYYYCIHRAEYDEDGFVTKINEYGITRLCESYKELYAEMNKMGLESNAIESIKSEDSLIYKDFFPKVSR